MSAATIRLNASLMVLESGGSFVCVRALMQKPVDIEKAKGLTLESGRASERASELACDWRARRASPSQFGREPVEASSGCTIIVSQWLAHCASK